MDLQPRASVVDASKRVQRLLGAGLGAPECGALAAKKPTVLLLVCSSRPLLSYKSRPVETDPNQARLRRKLELFSIDSQ